MRSSLTITLFSERPDQNQQPYVFLVSILTHGLAFGLIFWVIASAPKFRTPTIAERYAMRHFELHTLENEMQRALQKSKEITKEARKASLRRVVQAPPGAQTLVQPDIPKPITLKDVIPVPTVVLWNARNPQVKLLVAPKPEKPPVADVKPSVLTPNKELKLADIPIPASDLPTPALPIFAGSTSPIVVQGPKTEAPASLTTAQGTAQPSSGSVMSLSDQKMANGALLLPPVNESAFFNSPGGIEPGEVTDRDQTGNGNQTANAGSGQNGSGLGSHATTTHISRPLEGQFGAVVVGSSLEAMYPEAARLMSGRMSYTVYLHVGLPKSWILQYSLSLVDEAAAAGSISHIDAPWPYSIVRPNIVPGSINADALMVHGFVNRDGHFEGLKVVFPAEFAQVQFVLNSLAQWQFRSATQNGKNVKVEVLLIIPDIE
jgi:hypothetical protein